MDNGVKFSDPRRGGGVTFDSSPRSDRAGAHLSGETGHNFGVGSATKRVIGIARETMTNSSRGPGDTGRYTTRYYDENTT